MITIPTSLILGAGSSMDYGFPSGSMLKWKIINLLAEPKGEILETIADLGSDIQSATALSRELRFSAEGSIDAFLEHRPEFLLIGKIAIALVLCPYEHEEALFGIIFCATASAGFPYLFWRDVNRYVSNDRS